MKPSRVLALAVLVGLPHLAGQGCGEDRQIDPPDGRSVPQLKGQELDGPSADEGGAGFSFRVEDGVEDDRAGKARPIAVTQPLDAAATAKLLGRLPPVDAKAGDVVDFALREASKPPPLTGETIDAPFPPPDAPDIAPPDTDKRPLQVLRTQPEGDVPVAPRISVTFNTPMVAVTSHDTLAKDAVPVTVTPQIDGDWRWVGTKTLFFEPTGRAPMATDYAVEVPAGTKDAVGGSLSAAKRWTFRTPPPKIVSHRPGGDSVKLDPPFVVVFDQRIDPATVMQHMTVKAGGSTVDVVPLDPKAQAALYEATNEDIEGRWIAFKAKKALPKASKVEISFGSGMPSAEGPRKTEAAQGYSFETYGPLTLTEHKCGWRECRPGMPWRLEFSNQLDQDAFTADQVTVTPSVQGLEADVSWRQITLRGLTRGRTTYTVKIASGLKDTFGQTLGEDVAVEFEVGEAAKSMGTPQSGFVVLDPSAKSPTFPIYTINYDNIDLKMYQVTPADWPAFRTFMQRWRRDDGPKVPPGKKILDERVATKSKPDQLTEVPIKLAPGLTNGAGHVVIFAQPVGAEDDNMRERHSVIAWAQASDIALDAFVDSGELVAWATSLKDGTPIAKLPLTIAPTQITGTTDASGLAALKLTPASGGPQLLIANRQGEQAFLPATTGYWGDGVAWRARSQNDSVRWMVFDDRKLYRPSETVSVKGFMRVVEAGERGDVQALPAGSVTQVSWRVVGSRGNELTKGTSPVSRFGGFHLTFELPKTPNLGSARVEINSGLAKNRYGGVTHSHRFDIQEFRRPEFEVNGSSSQGPHFVGGSGTMTVAASYFAGGPLPNAEVAWNVVSRPGSYSPPNHSDFVFGTWVPWWESRGRGGDERSKSHAGTTDASGKHTLRLHFEASDPPRATSLVGSATVSDVNRQAWSASTTLLVHPADLYVGLKTPKRFVEPGEDITIEAVVPDLEGKRQAGVKVAVEMVRLAYKSVKGRGWSLIEVDAQQCELTSAADVVSCDLTPKKGGRHRIRATIQDGKQRPNQSTMTVWVAGGERPPNRKLEQETVELIPEQRTHQPGDTAKILVQAPFWPAHGVMTLRRDGVTESKVFEMQGPTHTLEIPIAEWHIPNLHVHVHLNGSAARVGADGAADPKLPRRPAYAVGSLRLQVPPTIRTLSVTATPAAKKTEPGAETSVELLIRDADGKPVSGAEMAVVVVDEAVLALTGYRIPDPVGIFYTGRGDGTSDYHSRSHVLLASVADLLKQAEAAAEEADQDSDGVMMMESGGAAPSPAAAMPRKMMKKGEAPGGGGDDASPIAVRKDFNALAVFAPEVKTDAQGKATVPFKLPDNLTRYRVMVIAAAGARHFGSGESQITARLPIMARMSPPRFLNFGDRFELPVVVQNQTDERLEVDVAVRVTNATLTDGAGRKVGVPANDRVEVRFPITAAKPGTARFQVGIAAGGWADAAEVSLPVWTPATTEAFATYGEIDGKGTVQPVQAPDDVVTAFGGLDVTTSSTQLQALTDAVIYLTSYPFECSEQLSSRVMSIAALKDVLSAFEAPGLPSKDELLAAVKRDMKKLSGMQNYDGGFGFWRRGKPSWPFNTVHVTHALARAKEKGFDVPQQMLNNAHQYLRDIRRHFPSTYPESVKRTIEAYALYVRLRLDDRDAKRARALLSEEGGPEKAGLEMVGWLYPVMSGAPGFDGDVAAIRKHLNNRVSETAAAANFVTSYSDGAHLLMHSSRRVDGLLLEGLIGDQPKSDLIPKLVRGLLGHKKKGRWGNTQENAWVLLGLDRYFNVYEKVEPNFVARVWLGDGFAGEHAFKGRTTERHNIQIPMAVVAQTKAQQNLTIAKQGKGRLYYRLGMKYAPTSLKLEPTDHGFTVERVYQPVDDDGDVTRDADGRWVIKAGARVRVRVTMVAAERRYHVALVDPLPAGLEALNPALKGTQPVPDDDEVKRGGRGHWRWWGPWYEHTNLRDERAEAFQSLLWSGVYTYSYVARATTPGTFVVPPSKAEEMYHPETFGRGASDIVVIR